MEQWRGAVPWETQEDSSEAELLAVSGTGQGGAGATGGQITEVTAKPQHGPLWWEVKLSQVLLLARKDRRGYKGVIRW